MRLRRGLAVLTGFLLTLGVGAPAHADAVRDQQWSLGVLRVAQAHAISQGEGVTVAVVDSGVDPRHPDLAGNVVKGIDTSRGGDGTTTDRTGHGTAMAALIAGHGHGPGGSAGILGVAPKAKILPVRIFPADGSALHPDDAANGIVAAVDAGARVICIASSGSDTPALARAVGYAITKEVLVVAAAGSTEVASTITWPAAYPVTVAVAGTHRSGQVSENSPRGADYGTIAVAAPGDEIVSATLGGRYATNSGTSNATALVAGVAALVRSKYPALDMNEVHRRVRHSATDAGRPGYDREYGNGVVNPVAALAAEVPSRTGPSASAPASAEPAAAGPRPDTALAWWEVAFGILVGAVIILGPLALIVVPVVLLVRRSRRRRAREQATAGWTPEEIR